MKKWFVVTLVALVSTMSFAADEWVDRELKDATKQYEERHFSMAFEICHNLLLVHRAAPLNRDAADQTKHMMSRIGKWLKASNPKVFSQEFLARAKDLGFVQAGPAWMPAEAKARLSAEAAARLERIGQSAVCATCKGACVTPCPNCQYGNIKCMACLGTGQAAGGGAVARAICPMCNGQGKSKCTFCAGSGVIVCPTCGGCGLGQ